MRFLADMGVSQQVVEWLRTNGHEAVHLRDEGLQRLPNGEIFQKAGREAWFVAGSFSQSEVGEMAAIRRVFAARIGPNLFGASVVQPVLTAVGVFTFLVGALYLPALGPTRVELVLALLLLAAVALLCTAVGQLAAILERLEGRVEKSAKPIYGPPSQEV
jgi:hypothetical protein